MLAGLLAGCAMFPLSAAVPPRNAVDPAITAPIAKALDAVQRMPGSYPTVAAVVVQGDAPPWFHVRGPVRPGDAAPADARTLFYIASQTKSFMGLLGAVLDRRGVLPLDTTLAAVWPSLRLPAPADPRRITLADLLSHEEGLTTHTLNFVTAYVRDIPAADYPRWLESEVQVRDPGFRYANIGDLIYGAALEAHTGRNWHDWLNEAVLAPLQLQNEVTSRPSQVVPARIVSNYQWDGHAWHPVAPKSDALMHAAGGLFASANGMARWMQANLGLSDAGDALQPGDFARAQEPVADARLSDGQIDCSGYSLGWYTCTYKGQHALMHGGAYVGTVSMTVLVPSARAGLSLVVNSDSAMEGFELEVMKAFIGLATGGEGEGARLDAAVSAFPARLAALVTKRKKALVESRADAAGAGSTWQPDAAALQACTGRFHDDLFGTLWVRSGAEGLTADIGARHLVLEPVRPGLFAAADGTLDVPEPMTCQPEAGVLEWRGRRFRSQAGR
ncbi:serine hydrolase domain-containing protein [Cognatiluteimonas weifangensis]|nr:serine hydrolase domain-containing protein [Luteimonas weifangensis]